MKLYTLVTAVAVTTLLAGAVIAPSSAAHATTAAAATSTTASIPLPEHPNAPIDFAAAKEQLLSQGTVLKITESPAGTATTIDLDGLTVTLTEPNPVSPRMETNLLPNAIVVTLNTTEQQALANGTAFAIGSALCELPVLGWIGCLGIQGALEVAGTWLGAEGLCKGEFDITFSLQSGDDNWMSYRCAA
ncbi:hypothetical protein [Plantibacter sp. RU18]|uniref:hypothetical protein n=1 Tax=Plantibacter sp. RU18 TaxID=3158143 RepID=UPI003D36FFEF